MRVRTGRGSISTTPARGHCVRYPQQLRLTTDIAQEQTFLKVANL